MRLVWVGALTALLTVPAYAGVPDDSAQVRPLSEGMRAPTLWAAAAPFAVK